MTDTTPQNNIGLAYFVARRFWRPGVDLDELACVACVALVRAHQRYSLANRKAARFSTYAVKCMTGAVLTWRHAERRWRCPQSKNPAAPDRRRWRPYIVLFSELGEGFVRGRANAFARTAAEAPDPAVNDLVGRLLGAVKEKYRPVVCLRFGIGHQYGYTLEEVARIMGITRERVRQMCERAITQMREAAEEAGLKFTD